MLNFVSQMTAQNFSMFAQRRPLADPPVLPPVSQILNQNSLVDYKHNYPVVMAPSSKAVYTRCTTVSDQFSYPFGPPSANWPVGRFPGYPRPVERESSTRCSQKPFLPSWQQYPVSVPSVVTDLPISPGQRSFQVAPQASQVLITPSPAPLFPLPPPPPPPPPPSSTIGGAWSTVPNYARQTPREQPTTVSVAPSIRLSQKRYSLIRPGEKKNTQGRPFTDTMSINLNMAASVDDIFLSCLGYNVVGLKTVNVEFSQVDKGTARQRAQHVNTPDSDELIKIDHNGIAAGVRQLFGVENFHFVQVVRSSTNQDNNVDRELRSLPVQKLIAIPCPDNDAEVTCKFLKQSIAHPRYKCNMKFYIVPCKLDRINWHYTSMQLLDQENMQISAGEIMLPDDAVIYPPSDRILDGISRRKRRRLSGSARPSASVSPQQKSYEFSPQSKRTRIGKSEDKPDQPPSKRLRNLSESSRSSVESTSSTSSAGSDHGNVYIKRKASVEMFNKMSVKVLVH
jgi:hypothetical protein